MHGKKLKESWVRVAYWVKALHRNRKVVDSNPTGCLVGPTFSQGETNFYINSNKVEFSSIKINKPLFTLIYSVTNSDKSQWTSEANSSSYHNSEAQSHLEYRMVSSKAILQLTLSVRSDICSKKGFGRKTEPWTPASSIYVHIDLPFRTTWSYLLSRVEEIRLNTWPEITKLRTCVYQGVRNDRFSEKFGVLCFFVNSGLKFALLLYYQRI